MVERIAFLTEFAMVRAVGVQSLADLAGVSQEVTLAAGDALFREGDVHDRLFLVIDGAIEASRRGLARSYGAREVVAGAAALSGDARRWTAVAKTRCRLLAIPIDACFDAMEEHFDLAQSTFASLAIQRERLLERLAEGVGPEGIELRE
jgi:CRP-like cAMP-binding protein